MSEQLPLFDPPPADQKTYWGPMQDTAHAGASFQRKELAQWMPLMESADAELLPELQTLVARSRDLSRNHGIAASGFQTQLDNIVGSSGLRLAATPDFRMLGKSIDWAESWSRDVEGLWRLYSDSFYFDAARQLNFNYMTTMVLRSILVSGEVLILPLWIEEPSKPFATTFQVVEGDRLSNPHYGPDTDKMRGGIEIDRFGKPIAYHIRKTYPFDWMIPGLYDLSAKWQRIPAETEWGRKRVLHLYFADRPGQTRGKPLLTSALEQFKMFDHYQRTELQSSIVNSLVAGVIETPMDQGAIADLMGNDPNAYLARKNEWRTSLKGGAMIPLYPGDKLTPFTPSRPATQYPSFVETVLRHIATALNMPYELLVKDFSKTNYSSARAALLEATRFFQGRRAWLSNNWASQVYHLWLEEAVNKGLIEAPDFYESRYYYCRAKWIGSGRGWIDPVKEAEAAGVRLATGISTLEMECAEQGLDWQDVLTQVALEYARMKQLGVYDQLVGARIAKAQSGGFGTSQDGGGTEETAPSESRG